MVNSYEAVDIAGPLKDAGDPPVPIRPTRWASMSPLIIQVLIYACKRSWVADSLNNWRIRVAAPCTGRWVDQLLSRPPPVSAGPPPPSPGRLDQLEGPAFIGIGRIPEEVLADSGALMIV